MRELLHDLYVAGLVVACVTSWIQFYRRYMDYRQYLRDHPESPEPQQETGAAQEAAGNSSVPGDQGTNNVILTRDEKAMLFLQSVLKWMLDEGLIRDVPPIPTPAGVVAFDQLKAEDFRPTPQEVHTCLRAIPALAVCSTHEIWGLVTVVADFDQVKALVVEHKWNPQSTVDTLIQRVGCSPWEPEALAAAIQGLRERGSTIPHDLKV